MDTAIVALTFALVLLTAYYAWQNHNMVVEMQRARESAAHPHLRIDLAPLGPMYVMVALANVGPGAAVGIDLTIEFHARATSTFDGERRRWRGELLASSEREYFYVPNLGDSMMPIDQLAACVDKITAHGTMTDVFGRMHTIDCSISDLDEWDELLRQARVRYERDPLDKLASEAEALRKSVERARSDWGTFGGGLHVRTDADIDAAYQEILAERTRRATEPTGHATREAEGAPTGGPPGSPEPVSSEGPNVRSPDFADERATDDESDR